jgi:hypothetical protein
LGFFNFLFRQLGRLFLHVSKLARERAGNSPLALDFLFDTSSDAPQLEMGWTRAYWGAGLQLLPEVQYLIAISGAVPQKFC